MGNSLGGETVAAPDEDWVAGLVNYWRNPGGDGGFARAALALLCVVGGGSDCRVGRLAKRQPIRLAQSKEIAMETASARLPPRLVTAHPPQTAPTLPTAGGPLFQQVRLDTAIFRAERVGDAWFGFAEALRDKRGRVKALRDKIRDDRIGAAFGQP